MNRLIAACSMVKNESEFFKICLSNIKKNIKDIFIIDTGSTDNTIEIASLFTRNIIKQNFANDFSAVRNKFFDYVDSKWILAFDGDEAISGLKTNALSEQLVDENIMAFAFPRINYLGDGHLYFDTVIRLFRNNPNIRYNGRIFEQILVQSEQLAFLSIPFHHFAYLKDDLKVCSKIAKYRKLVEEKIATDKKAHGKVEFIHLYSMLSICCLYMNEIDLALKICLEGLEEKEFAWFYVIIGSIYMNKGEFEGAEDYFLRGIKFCSNQVSVRKGGLSDISTLFKNKITNKLAQLYNRMGEQKKALNLYNSIDSQDFFYERVVLINRQISLSNDNHEYLRRLVLAQEQTCPVKNEKTINNSLSIISDLDMRYSRKRILTYRS